MNRHFLIFEQDSHPHHCRMIHEGIRKYFQTGDHFLTFLPLGFSDLDNVEGDHTEDAVAILCWLDFDSSVDPLERLNIPYLNLRESERMSNVGLTLMSEGEGTLAANFFIDEMGFDSLVFVGLKNKFSHQRRCREFARSAQKRGVVVDERLIVPKWGALSERSRSPFIYDKARVDERNAILSDLLLSVSKPAGIFCADDLLALNLYYRAHQLRIRVPEEVSILGVGSLQGAEERGMESISVIQMDHVRQGFLGAKLIESYVRGDPIREPIVLTPDGIVHRSTTTRRAYKEPLIRKAFELLDEDRSITVSGLSARLGVSRRTLETRFRSVTNMGVAQAIDYERFCVAKKLLKSNRYSHDAIAGLAGYRNHRQMLRSFDRFIKMSPKQFWKAYIDNSRE